MEYLNSPYIVEIYFVKFSLNLRSISEVIMDWMFVSPRNLCWSSNTQRNSMWRRGLWEVITARWSYEGGALTLGSVHLQEETLKSFVRTTREFAHCTHGLPTSTHKENTWT